MYGPDQRRSARVSPLTTDLPITGIQDPPEDVRPTETYMIHVRHEKEQKKGEKRFINSLD